MSVNLENSMKEYSVAELLREYSFFVPEIQREYVWGMNNRDILSAFCNDIIAAKNEAVNDDLIQQQIVKLTQEKKFSEITQLLEDAKKGSSLNIGFLYSYKPNYKMESFPDFDLINDTYLIDGQQRFTSLFLILYYLAIRENKKTVFLKLIRFDYKLSTAAFDYRVRSLTHDFVIKLLNEVAIKEDFDLVEKATWFNESYKQDTTIKSMVNAFKIIKDCFSDEEDDCYDYILNKVRFWHFKTEKTNQGEELYITMNSRGKQLEENETVRAKLFEQISDDAQSKWSEKWENWQDYFWKNKGKNKNADDGFNEFFKCIAGLESYLKGCKDFVTDSSLIYDSHLLNNLSLELIESYFNSYMNLLNDIEAFSNKYEYSGWITKAISEFQNILLSKTNWFVDYEDPNKATERMRMVFVWSMLFYVRSCKNGEALNIDNLYRVLRIYWLRYNNHDRNVVLIQERVTKMISNGIWSQTSTTEEELKHTFYTGNIDNKILEFESKIWRIEDHRLNINGYQVDNINSIHLIDYTSVKTPEELDVIYTKFISLFPEGYTGADYSSKINDLLMFYDFYGMRRSPFYYYNYDFGSWRRIIRDLDSSKNAFKTFFEEYDGGNLNELLKQKQIDFIRTLDLSEINTEHLLKIYTLIDTIRMYIILCDNIWKKGLYLAYEDWNSDIDCLTIYEKNEEGIYPFKRLYNSKGNFRGYNYTAIYQILPKNYLELINEWYETNR